MRSFLSSRSPVFKLISQIGLAALFALFGLLIFAQLRSARSLQLSRVGSSSTDRAAVLSGLVESNLKLQDEVATLKSRLTDLERQGGSLQSMVGELNQLKLINGLLEVTGPGITVTLDSPISATELQDLLNELRNAGAEAIALNGQRLIVRSMIISTDSGISVDGTLIARPFVFQALGAPDTVRVALTRRGGILASLQAAHPGFDAEVDEAESLTIPIYSRKLELQYSRAPAVKN